MLSMPVQFGCFSQAVRAWWHDGFVNCSQYSIASLYHRYVDAARTGKVLASQLRSFIRMNDIIANDMMVSLYVN